MASGRHRTNLVRNIEDSIRELRLLLLRYLSDKSGSILIYLITVYNNVQYTVHRLYQAGTPQFNRRARGDAGANEQAGIGFKPSLYYTI